MKTLHARRAQAGQTIFHTMLIISCVALALAIFFPIYELFELHRGEVREHKFVPSAAPAAAPTPKPTPKPKEAPEPAPPAEGGAEEAPKPAEEPKPAEAAEPKPAEAEEQPAPDGE